MAGIGPLQERGRCLGVAAPAADDTDARGLAISPNSFCTARLREPVEGGGAGGWFSLAKGVATRVWARGDGVGEEARDEEEEVERRGEEEEEDEGAGVERYLELTSRARRRGRGAVVVVMLSCGGGGGGMSAEATGRGNAQEEAAAAMGGGGSDRIGEGEVAVEA